MDIVKTKEIKLNMYISFALPLVYAGLFIVLWHLEAMNARDLAITLAAVIAFACGAVILCRLGMERFVFIPLVLLMAVVSYAASDLLSRGSFTWSSETNSLLHIFGLAWVVSLLLVLYALSGSVSVMAAGGGAAALIFGIANYVMLQYRGRMLLAGDITALRTAVNVAGTYSLEMSGVFITSVLLLLACCVFCINLGRPAGDRPSRLWRAASRIAVLVPVAGYALLACCTGMIEDCGIRLTWNENDFEESPVLYFVESIEEMSVDKPEGYSEASLDGISSCVENPYAGSGVKPHIIVIMSEAFSDLGVIGELETSEEVTPFIDSLTENAVRGYVYASVLGGGTANSEFEFLTGCSMAFIAKGVSPYQQYIKYNKDTLVSVLESQGYSSTALHPYDASGWNREAVYDCFGFDDVSFIDKFQNKSYLRGYVTDESDYENLIKVFEDRDEDELMFIFNITMQNHGSYNSESYESAVSVVGHEGEYPQAEQYLSLIKESDEATKELVEYFSAQDEPVIILFFGDHQPNLEDEFYEMLYGKTVDERSLEERQRKYLTPFFIWANYDIEEADAGNTSINYLSAMLLETAGLEKSDFEAYLLGMQDEWPAINAYGYVNAAGEHLAAESDEILSSESIAEYRVLQYNYLFDTEGYLNGFFGLG